MAQGCRPGLPLVAPSALLREGADLSLVELVDTRSGKGSDKLDQRIAALISARLTS